MFRELRSLVSMVGGEFEQVRCELDSATTEEFDVSLDRAVAPVSNVVVFAILVVDMIDWEELRAVIDRSVAGPELVALDVLLCSETELMDFGGPLNIVVLETGMELEKLAFVAVMDAGSVEFERLATVGAVPATPWPPEVFKAKDGPLEFSSSEPLLETVVSLVEPAESLVLDCWIDPVVLPFESIVWFNTVVDAVNSTMPGPRSAVEPFEKGPLDGRILIVVVLIEIFLLSAPVSGVWASTEMASTARILDSDEARFNGRVWSWALTAIFVVVMCVSVMMVTPTLAAIKEVKRETQIILTM
jgi:hypothetical protein